MSNVHGMIRSAYTFDADAVSNETALDCGDESVTQQCFKDECDINILLAKYQERILLILRRSDRQLCLPGFSGSVDFTRSATRMPVAHS